MRHTLMSFVFLLVAQSVPWAAQAQFSEQKTVVVTIKPIHSLVAAVMQGIEGVGLPKLLVDGSQSPHDFQLRPEQMSAIQQADLIFYIDDSYETFLKNAFETLPENTHTIALARDKNISLLPLRNGGVWEKDEHHHHDGHDKKDGNTDEQDDAENNWGTHQENRDANGFIRADIHALSDEPNGASTAYDMHVWLNPLNAIAMTRTITSELARIYPEHILEFEKNRDLLIQQIEALDKKIMQQFDTIKTAPYIVFHDAYHYADVHYHLSAVGSITFTPEESPTPTRIKTIREKIKQSGATCVFTEPYVSESIMNTITEGFHIRHATLDPEGIALEPSPTLYETLMQQFSDSLTTCLKDHQPSAK
jgi:zinc transport system substrate-binding protein